MKRPWNKILLHRISCLRQLSIPPQAGSHFPMKQHSIVMKKAVTRQTIAGATAIFHNLFQ